MKKQVFANGEEVHGYALGILNLNHSVSEQGWLHLGPLFWKQGPGGGPYPGPGRLRGPGEVWSDYTDPVSRALSRSWLRNLALVPVNQLASGCALSLSRSIPPLQTKVNSSFWLDHAKCVCRLHKGHSILTVNVKGTLCRNYSNLVVKLYIASN